MDFTKTIKSLKLFLATVLVGSASLSANADTFQDESSGLYFETSDDGTCSVVKPTSGTYSGDIVIPSTVTYNGTEYSVTAIGAKAFESCYLTSMTIPESITSIGDQAFYWSTPMTKVEITNLEAWCKIDFGIGYSNPLSYKGQLYLNGEKITNLVIPESITEIKDYTFFGCYSITSVTFPKNLISIGDYAFSLCKYLPSINIPDGVTTIGDGAFNGDIFTSITVPNSVTSIGDWAFYSCNNLTSITLSQNLTTIGNHVFQKCSSLTSITIPEGVTDIKTEAFQDCSSLTSVILPTTLTNISTRAFYRCSSLTSINFPENLTSIGSMAFCECTSLESIKFPDSLTLLCAACFEDCTSLKYVQFGSKLETIDFTSFKGCTSLIGTTTTQFTGEEQNVLIIPDSVKNIGSNSFENCTSLEHVWIGDGCTWIGTEAFAGDTGLITISSRNEVAPSLEYKNTFSDETYETATLYIRAGEDVWNSYIDDSKNYWYLFLNRDGSTYGTDDGGIQVGVGEVANDDIAVTIDGKAIEITGYEGETSVYNVAGMRVYQGTDNRIELPNEGIYVVIVNGKPYKVAIK